MADRKMAANSLDNLSRSNQEARALTRESLETALLFLLDYKSLAQITISELTAKAGVSRNAFYRHYSSKEELLRKTLQKSVLKIVRDLQNFNLLTERRQAWHFLFSRVRQESRLLHLAKHQHFNSWLEEIVLEGLERYQRRKSQLLSTYINSFWASAVVSVLTKWIREGMSIPEEEMALIDLPLLP